MEINIYTQNIDRHDDLLKLFSEDRISAKQLAILSVLSDRGALFARYASKQGGEYETDFVTYRFAVQRFKQFHDMEHAPVKTALTNLRDVLRWQVAPSIIDLLKGGRN